MPLFKASPKGSSQVQQMKGNETAEKISVILVFDKESITLALKKKKWGLEFTQYKSYNRFIFKN